MPEQASLTLVISNRLISLAAIGLGITFALYYLNLRKRHDRLQKDLHTGQQQLQRYRQWLDLTARHNPIGLWWYDTVRDRLHWSESTTRLHGMPLEHTPLMSEAINFYPAPHDQTIRECFSRCRDNGEAYDRELPMVTADGRQLSVRTTGEAQYDKAGHIVAVVGTIQDLTQLRATTIQLNESQRRLQHFLDAIPVTVWTANPDGAVDYLSRTIIEFSGVPKEQISEPGYWLTLVHRDDQDRCAETWMKSVETGTPYQIHFRFRRYDGEYIWHLVSANPVRDSEGRIIKWYGSAVELPTDY
ncbi:PAS domain-containing protein [Marinimicrobium sp. C2-29]|uniref:PAS domain-containing protein n=1 Tax=Marinimicrobium sp. C2-29 TaxID=3139825 RepID=UPI0031393053